jgi:hypothetical protein
VKRTLCVAALALCACGKNKDANWVEQRQQAEDEKKAQTKVEKEKERQAQLAPKADNAPKDPYWDDPTLIRVDNEKACPEGIWALYKDKAPGADSAEQKKNEAKRAELAKNLAGSRFVTYLRSPTDVKLLDYDAPKGWFPVELSGLIDCQDSAGHVAVGFNAPKAFTPPSSAAKQGAEVTLRLWSAKPLAFTLPMKSMGEAKDWKVNHQLDLEARVVFKLGKTEVDKKIFKTSKVAAAGITMGGGNEDWGAGRAVHTVVEGVRLTTDHNRTVLVDTRKK